MNQKYQGDISIIPATKKMEKIAKKLIFKRLKGSLVVAEGEVTGHKHILEVLPETDIEVAKDEFGYFVKIDNGSAILTHQEHKVQEIGVGLTWIGRQYEFDEINERRVQD
jgi:hypothetical protein